MSAQRDYWDLSEKERANLTREQVEGFAAFELMRLGVLAVPPLVLETEPDVTLPERKPFFRPSTHDPRYNSRDEWGVAFETQEQVRAFLALKPFRVRSHYIASDNLASAAPWPVDGGEFAVVELADEAQVLAKSEAYRQLSGVRERNRKAREEHDKASRQKNEALKAMWEDWEEQRSQQSRLQRVIDTWQEYCRLTSGDEEIAVSFLDKVFDRKTQNEASKWFGVRIPHEFQAKEQPAPKSAVETAGDSIPV
jgi:hypothetical protein